MKRFMIAMAVCAMALSACAPMTADPASNSSTGVSGVVAKAGTVVLTGARAFAAAELGYTTAADGVGILVDHGVIKGAAATRVRALNAQARGVLVKGKATADMAEKARLATQLFGITDSLNAIKGSI